MRLQPEAGRRDERVSPPHRRHRSVAGSLGSDDCPAQAVEPWRNLEEPPPARWTDNCAVAAGQIDGSYPDNRDASHRSCSATESNGLAVVGRHNKTPPDWQERVV